MSNAALTWAFAQPLASGEKFVLVVLADFADEAGSCYPSQARIASMTGHGVSTVARHLKSLEGAGYLSRTHRTKSGHRTSDRYVLNLATSRIEGKVPTSQIEQTYLSNRENLPLELGEEPLVREPSEREPSESVSAVAATAPRWAPEVDPLCTLLADLVEANGAKRPTVTDRWRDAVRLMVERDGRTYSKIEAAIRWAQADEFWRANILAMPKLRERYDQLSLQAQRQRATGGDRMAEHLEGARRMAATGGATRVSIEGLL